MAFVAATLKLTLANTCVWCRELGSARRVRNSLCRVGHGLILFKICTDNSRDCWFDLKLFTKINWIFHLFEAPWTNDPNNDIYHFISTPHLIPVLTFYLHPAATFVTAALFLDELPEIAAAAFQLHLWRPGGAEPQLDGHHWQHLPGKMFLLQDRERVHQKTTASTYHVQVPPRKATT